MAWYAFGRDGVFCSQACSQAAPQQGGRGQDMTIAERAAEMQQQAANAHHARMAQAQASVRQGDRMTTAGYMAQAQAQASLRGNEMAQQARAQQPAYIPYSERIQVSEAFDAAAKRIAELEAQVAELLPGARDDSASLLHGEMVHLAKRTADAEGRVKWATGELSRLQETGGKLEAELGRLRTELTEANAVIGKQARDIARLDRDAKRGRK